MNAKELAEKIFLMRGMFFDNKIGQEIHVSRLEPLLAEAMEEARKEGWDEGYLDLKNGVPKLLAEAKAEAFETAAKIVEEWIEPKPDWVINTAMKIRQRAKEIK